MTQPPDGERPSVTKKVFRCPFPDCAFQHHYKLLVAKHWGLKHKKAIAFYEAVTGDAGAMPQHINARSSSTSSSSKQGSDPVFSSQSASTPLVPQPQSLQQPVPSIYDSHSHPTPLEQQIFSDISSEVPQAAGAAAPQPSFSGALSSNISLPSSLTQPQQQQANNNPVINNTLNKQPFQYTQATEQVAPLAPPPPAGPQAPVQTAAVVASASSSNPVLHNLDATDNANLGFEINSPPFLQTTDSISKGKES